MNDFPLLTAITLTPLLGAALVIGLGQEQKWLARKLASMRTGAAPWVALVEKPPGATPPLS